jgi:hypothetical protein
MSIPIEFQVKNLTVSKEERYATLIQLKDGSVYIITAKDGFIPVSRSFAGMVLKENMRHTMSLENEFRRKKKLAEKSKDFIMADNFDKAVAQTDGTLYELRRAWVEFKAHGSKTEKKQAKGNATIGFSVRSYRDISVIPDMCLRPVSQTTRKRPRKTRK